MSLEIIIGLLVAAFAGGAWISGRLRRNKRSPHVPPAESVTPNTSTKIDELDDEVATEIADVAPPPDPADYPDDDPDAVSIVSGWTDSL